MNIEDQTEFEIGKVLLTQTELDFLRESNAIEREYDDVSLYDAAEAWEYLKKECCTPPLQMILEAHRLLMRRLRPDIAGKLRYVDVWVGHRPCPSPTLISGMLNEWIKKYVKKAPKTAKKIQEAHVAFEHIHPFEDGNGRTGRLLYNLQRIKANLPIHVIHEGEEQWEYYKWFTG